MKLTTKLWIGILVLVIFSPLGLLLPSHFKSGSAWGEWSVDEVKQLAGYVPKGLEKLSTLWKAPIPDYAFEGWQDKGLSHLGFAYILSGILGVIITVAAILVIGRILGKKGD